MLIPTDCGFNEADNVPLSLKTVLTVVGRPIGSMINTAMLNC